VGPSAAPATPAAIKTASGEQVAYDPFLDGPADPASIDLLAEGGFDEEKSYQGRRVSLDFKDADIANILRLIAEVSDLNVIAGQEVTGKVTIRLVDVPWDQALDVILLTKGLGFVRIGNILRIAPVETLKMESEARLQDRRSREKLEDLVVKLQPVNFAKASDLGKLVKRLLSSRGSVNVDDRTNTLIIKDIPSVIHEATALVKAVDTQTPQVLIEAKIVEATLNFSRGLGVLWGVGWDSPQDAADTIQPNLLPGLGLQQNNFLTANPIGNPTGLLNFGILGLDDKLQLDMQLQAGEENRQGKVISSPRVVTLDNKQAVIKQGVAIKFTEVTSDKINTSFVDAVLELKVTPHITANRSIIMKLGVSKNSPNLSTATGDVVGINKNETKTEAILRDGETMVLGGIYVVDNGHGSTKVPFLADIPGLGVFFRNNEVKDERRELLVFVTPRIVQGLQTDVQ
jgi:type IV pilus assembly protein PilQ